MRKHILNMVFQFYFKTMDSLVPNHNLIIHSFNISCYNIFILSHELLLRHYTIKQAEHPHEYILTFGCPDKNDVHALSCVCCRRYMKSSSVSRRNPTRCFWLTTLKRGLKANQGSTCIKAFGRLYAPQVKVNHYRWEKQTWDNIPLELDPAQSYLQLHSSLFTNIKRKPEGVVENRHWFLVSSFLCPGPFVWNSALFLSRETVIN